MKVEGIYYAGGVKTEDLVSSLDQLISSDDIYGFLAGNEDTTRRLKEKVADNVREWVKSREPWLDYQVYGPGEHNVTPVELQEGEWEYILVVSDGPPVLRRQRKQDEEEKGLAKVVMSARRKVKSFLDRETVEQQLPAVVPDPGQLLAEHEQYPRVYSIFFPYDDSDGDSFDEEPSLPKDLVTT